MEHESCRPSFTELRRSEAPAPKIRANAARKKRGTILNFTAQVFSNLLIILSDSIQSGRGFEPRARTITGLKKKKHIGTIVSWGVFNSRKDFLKCTNIYATVELD